MRGLPGLLVIAALAASSTRPPELLPRDEEMALALSAGPPHLRDGAAVYVLGPKGYQLAREGANGFTCIVNRDHPLSRKPTCYDAEGTATILPKVLYFGELLMEGLPLSEIEGRIKEGFRSGRFISPRRPGIAYMLSDGNRDADPSTGATRPFPPHVMFYAPNLNNRDIGSTGDGAAGLPFIAYPGPHAYMIMMVPQAGMTGHAGPAEEAPAPESVPVERRGIAVGEKAPPLDATDQLGAMRSLESMAGPRGLVLLFVRSADW